MMTGQTLMHARRRDNAQPFEIRKSIRCYLKVLTAPTRTVVQSVKLDSPLPRVPPLAVWLGCAG